MSTPSLSVARPDPSVAPAARLSWRDVCGPLLSLLCLVHCLGFAVVAPLLPGAAAFLDAGEAFEWGLFLLACSVALWLTWRTRRRLPTWIPVAVGGASVLGLLGLLGGWEWPQRTSLAVLALLQVMILARRVRRAASPGHQAACCSSAVNT